VFETERLGIIDEIIGHLNEISYLFQKAKSFDLYVDTIIEDDIADLMTELNEIRKSLEGQISK